MNNNSLCVFTDNGRFIINYTTYEIQSFKLSARYKLASMFVWTTKDINQRDFPKQLSLWKGGKQYSSQMQKEHRQNISNSDIKHETNMVLC